MAVNAALRTSVFSYPCRLCGDAVNHYESGGSACHERYDVVAGDCECTTYLDNKCAVINSLIDEKQALIEDLELFKRSLIYEVATGKRKVV